MRIFYLGNNLLGLRVLEFLKKQKEKICGLAVHLSEKAKYVNEIINCSRLEKSKIISGDRINGPETVKKIERLKPDIILSICFGYILKPEIIRVPPLGVINLHSAYLPCNRGANPNVWSIVNATPAGVSLHYIDAGIDTGDIIAQEQVPVDWLDTARTLYEKLEKEAFKLFQQSWPDIKSGKIKIRKQVGKGSFHRLKDLERIDRIDLGKKYKAKDLINILRSRTFPPYNGAYIEVNGRRIYLRLELYES